MIRNYLEARHVKEWARGRCHRVLDEKYSSDFDKFLCSLPWAGSHIDWRELAYEQIEIPEVVDANFLALCRNTDWGSHEYVFIMYNRGCKSLLCKLEDAVTDLDLLYSEAPGTRFICGADVEGESIQIIHADFAEYDGFSRLIFPRMPH